MSGALLDSRSLRKRGAEENPCPAPPRRGRANVLKIFAAMRKNSVKQASQKIV